MSRRLCAALLGTAVAASTLIVVAPLATAEPPPQAGTSSLAALLASDGNRFDTDPTDFDLLDQSVAAVLAAKPDSPVGVLADGTVALTAFLPNDLAFRILLQDLTGQTPKAEPDVLAGLVAAVGVDTIETVLLYHVVPGATIDSRTALRSDGAALATAVPDASITVDVLSIRKRLVRLIDLDPTDINPVLIREQLDLNEGNVQIAHGIPLVLRPADL